MYQMAPLRIFCGFSPWAVYRNFAGSGWSSNTERSLAVLDRPAVSCCLPAVAYTGRRPNVKRKHGRKMTMTVA